MGSPMHGAYGIGFVTFIAPALCLVEVRRFRNSKLLYWVTIIASFAGIFYFWLIVFGLDPIQYQGITQRFFGTINALWPTVFAYLILKQKTSTLND